MKNLIFLFSLLTLFACSSERSDTAVSAIIPASEVPIKIIPVSDEGASATLYIEGMSCQKMCVSKINKTLADIEGVEVTEVDFDTERPIDHFTVSFDEDKLTEQDLIKAVQGIAGGVYKVKNVEVRKQVDSSSSASVEKGSKKNRFRLKRKQVSNRQFSIPNVFDVLKKLGGL